MNTNLSNVTINANAQIPYKVDYDKDTNTRNIEISPLVAKTYNELLRRFKENDGQSIELTMKNGDKIVIERFAPPFESQWFTVENPTNLFMDTDNLLEIAGDLCNYEKLLKAQKEQKENLIKFFDKHLARRTGEELHLGNELVLAPDTAVIKDICETYNLTTEQQQDLVDLAENYQHYSDWYKSVYQRRPKFGVRPTVD